MSKLDDHWHWRCLQTLLQVAPRSVVRDCLGISPEQPLYQCRTDVLVLATKHLIRERNSSDDGDDILRAARKWHPRDRGIGPLLEQGD